MKVLVDELPTNTKECLFVTLGYINNGKKLKSCPKCNIDDSLCDIAKGHKCNKLKVLKCAF